MSGGSLPGQISLPALQRAYSEGQRLGSAGEFTRANEIWQKIARDTENIEPLWLGSWVLFHAAGVLAEKKEWPRSDKLFDQAMQRAAHAAPEIRAQLLDAWCHAFVLRSNWPDAVKNCQEAVQESGRWGEDTMATASYRVYLGRVFTSQGDLPNAEQQLTMALAIQQRLAPDSIAVADTFFRLGVVATQTGQMVQAEDFIKKALVLQQKLTPGMLPVARSLARLAILRVDAGDLSGAEEYYQQAIVIQREVAPDSVELASTLCGMAIAATNRGKLAEASKLYQEALATYKKADPEGQGTGVVLSLIAQLDWARDDLAKAEKNFLSAAKILKKTSPDTGYYSYCLLGLGILRYLNGDLAKSEEYLREMLAIQLKTAPTHLFTADAFSHLGSILADRGDLAQAEEYYQKALKIEQQQAPLGPRTGQTLDNLRDLAERRGDLHKAEEYCRQALAIFQQVAPGSASTADLLASLANIMQRTQQPEIAAQLYEQSLGDLEKQMGHVGGSDDTRSRFRARRSTPYFQYIDLLVKQQKAGTALEVLERFRARSLLETMASARVDISSGVDPGLLQKERSLRATLNAKSDKRIRLAGGTHTPEELVSLDKEISDLTSEHQEIEGRIRDTSPAYASLMQPQPLSARQIQETLIDRDTVLLEYALGEERSYVFTVTRDSLAAFELPPRKSLEEKARSFYRLLAAPRAQQRPAENRYAEVAAELSRMVLGPVAAELGNKRIVVVADGALQFVPFTALPDPGARQPRLTDAQTPLVVHHEVVDLPSASVLAVLRLQEAARPAHARRVAVLADPVFDKLDPRVMGNPHSGPVRKQHAGPLQQGNAKISNPESATLLSRSAADVGLTRNAGGMLPRLLFSRREADAILAVFPAGTGKALLDFSANRGAATSPELSQYRIIHFATHGLLNSERPELSGLVLSMVDKRGNPQDGFLQLQDIYNLNLPADLVVLSACGTALGQEISGDGLIGLTRGFMYAGASRVVASLWNVSDVATAKLMAEFYRAMEKDGMPASAALRAAQIKMWKQQRWSEPYYWAAFQIQGEWK